MSRPLLSTTLLALLLLAAGCGKNEAPPPPPLPPALPPAGAAAPVPDAGATAPTTPVRVKPLHRVLEAEQQVRLVPPFEVAEEAGTGGGQVVRIPFEASKGKQPAGVLELRTRVEAPTTAHLWFRVYWMGECSNSFDLRLNDGATLTVGQNAVYNTWHWVKLRQPQELSAGDLVITLSEREDGIALDQILLTHDAEFVPMGVE